MIAVVKLIPRCLLFADVMKQAYGNGSVVAFSFPVSMSVISGFCFRRMPRI